MLVRELFTKLGLDVNAQSFAKGNLLVEGVKLGLSKLADAVINTAKEFTGRIQEMANSAKDIEETAQATGLNTKSLQELRGVARATGVEVADFDTAMFKFSRTLYAAKQGGEQQAAALAKLHVRFKNADGTLRDTDDTLLGVAQAFSQMHDGAEKTALAMELFGRSGARLIPMLNKGEDEINSLRSSVVVLTDEQLRAGKELTQTQRQLGNLTTKLWRGAIAPLLPALNDLLKQYLAWRKANAEIMRQRIQAVIGYAIQAVRALGKALSVVITIVRGLSGGLGEVLRLLREHPAVLAAVVAGLLALRATAVVTAAQAVAAWVVAAAPFLALAAAVGAVLLLLDDIRGYNQGKKSLFGLWHKEIDSWLEPKENDVWWLKAVRALGQTIKDIVEGNYFKRFSQLFEAIGTWQAHRMLGGDVQLKGEAAELAPGGGKKFSDLTPEELEALRRRNLSLLRQAQNQAPPAAVGYMAQPGRLPGGGVLAPGRLSDMTALGAVPDDLPAGQARALPAALPAGRGVLAPQFHAEIKIDARGVQSPQQLGPYLDQHLDQWWDRKMEDAAAASGNED